MIRIGQPGPCLPSTVAAFETAARAAEAERLHSEQEARAEFMNARAQWAGQPGLPSPPAGFAAMIAADLKADYDALMDAAMQDMLGDLENWHPTGILQTEAGR